MSPDVKQSKIHTYTIYTNMKTKKSGNLIYPIQKTFKLGKQMTKQMMD